MKTSDFLDDEVVKAIEVLKGKGLIPKDFNPDEEILISRSLTT